MHRESREVRKEDPSQREVAVFVSIEQIAYNDSRYREESSRYRERREYRRPQREDTIDWNHKGFDELQKSNTEDDYRQKIREEVMRRIQQKKSE